MEQRKRAAPSGAIGCPWQSTVSTGCAHTHYACLCVWGEGGLHDRRAILRLAARSIFFF